MTSRTLGHTWPLPNSYHWFTGRPEEKVQNLPHLDCTPLKETSRRVPIFSPERDWRPFVPCFPVGPWRIAPVVCSSFGSSAQALKLLLLVIHPRDVAFAPVSCIFPQGNPHSYESRTPELKACTWCTWLKARSSQSSRERGSKMDPRRPARG